MTDGSGAKCSGLSGLKKLDPNCVYKVMDATDWEVLQAQGSHPGSAVDLKDGFVHLSLASQVEGTLKKHFEGVSDLVLVVVEARRLGSQLRWERSIEEELFPHLYAELPASACKAVAKRGASDQPWTAMSA